MQAQESLGVSSPPLWTPSGDRLLVAAAFVAFVRGQQGPGLAGDRAWVGAVLVDRGRLVGSRVVPGVAGASYVPGLLALREGAMLAEALAPLAKQADVVMVDATGRDHPRRAGLAVQLGAMLDRPSVGVTHRRLQARVVEPDVEAGSTGSVWVEGVEVARVVRTATGVRPVVAHAGWRTDASTAAQVVLASRGGARTPEPLRHARHLARTTRERHPFERSGS
jgi:deoxyribonuclease V